MTMETQNNKEDNFGQGNRVEDQKVVQQHPFRNALLLTLGVIIVIAVALFFMPFFWAAPIIVFLQPSPDLLAQTGFVALIVALLIWIWKKAVQHRYRVGGISEGQTVSISHETNFRTKKILLVITFPIVVFAITVGMIILNEKCCTVHSGGEDWSGFGYIIIIIFATIVSVIVGVSLTSIATKWKTMWLVATILSVLYAVVIFYAPVSNIVKSNIHQQRFARELQTSKNSDDISNCSVLVTDAYADNRGGAINYSPWRDCISRTLKTNGDYQLCKQQAGFAPQYDSSHLVSELTGYCDFTNIIVNPQSLTQCAQFSAQQLEACLEHFIVDEQSFTQCISQITDNNKTKVCYIVYAKVSHDPIICEKLTSQIPSVYIGYSDLEDCRKWTQGR